MMQRDRAKLLMLGKFNYHIFLQSFIYLKGYIVFMPYIYEGFLYILAALEPDFLNHHQQ